MSTLQWDEIEKYGRIYFEYVKLCEDHSAILRQDAEECLAAHARVSEELKAEHAGSLPASARSIEQIHSYMDELARKCKVKAQSFDDHMRICFCSLRYVQLLLEHDVGVINVGPVLQVGSRLLMGYLPQRPLPPLLGPFYDPEDTDLIPDEPFVCKVTSSNIETWRSNPEELIGKSFTPSDEFLSTAFQIFDYSVKTVKGAQYDVLYRDQTKGLRGKDELLEELADCYLILN